jgi:hypothetical protein
MLLLGLCPDFYICLEFQLLICGSGKEREGRLERNKKGGKMEKGEERIKKRWRRTRGDEQEAGEKD